MWNHLPSNAETSSWGDVPEILGIILANGLREEDDSGV